MYNIIAYVSFVLGIVLGIIFILDLILLPSLVEDNYILILGFTIGGLGQIYYKIHTKPISQAIKEFWNAKVNNKSNISQEDTPKTYEEYKRNKK